MWPIVAVVVTFRNTKRFSEPSNGLSDTVIKILWKHNSDIKYFIGDHFFLKPCAKCANVDYSLLELNGVGTAIHLQCISCKKKTQIFWV